MFLITWLLKQAVLLAYSPRYQHWMLVVETETALR